MCHFLPVHHLGIAFLGRVEGQNITYVVGDINVHEKLSKLKDGKHTNFVATMNVPSLAVTSPIFGCYVAVSSCLKLCVAS